MNRKFTVQVCRRRCRLAVAVAASWLMGCLSATAQSLAPFRTDAQGAYSAAELRTLASKDRDSVPQWYQLVDGRFPPEGSAHKISGELIRIDHPERRFHLRVDRDDSQSAGHLDLPIDVTMLPYGSIWYHGAPAALQDIPIGTHVHGLFYHRSPTDTTPPPANLHMHGRQSKEVDFNRCIRLEDDFSHDTRQSRLWKISTVDLKSMKLTAQLVRGGESSGDPRIFDLQLSTVVRQGRSFAELDALQPGQQVLFNLTWATLFGSGRLLEIWLDDDSRRFSSTQQTRRHHDHIRERGLPGWIESVDDAAEIVTITFFDTFDPALFEDIKRIHEPPIGWPLIREPKDALAPKGTIAVARESLLTFDPLNDRHGGSILKTEKLSPQPGDSGVRIHVQCDLLLEGYRPRRIVRFFPAAWPVKFPPLEERFQSF
ncbi:MAG: hypothetical protein ACKO2P_07095 [Planctomycetota bacterium]